MVQPKFSRNDSALVRDEWLAQDEREPLDDLDEDTIGEWLWSRSRSRFQTALEVLDPDARAVLDAFPWRYFPTHGDGPEARRAVYANHAAELKRREPVVKDRRGSLNPNAILDESTVLRMREEFAAGRSPAAMAEETGASEVTIRSAIAVRTWAHLGGAVAPKSQRRT